LKIVLFFTYNVSLSRWAESGLLDREILLYKSLSKKGVDVLFITYGGSEDYEYQSSLDGIKIIPFYSIIKKPKSLLMEYMYSLFLPYVLRKELNEADIFKTNQIWGSWSAIIAKILFNKPLIVRCGFEKYYNLTRNTSIDIKTIFWKLITWFVSIVAYYFSDRIILTSNLAKNFVINTFGVNDKKIDVFYNFIDIDNFKPLGMTQYFDRVLFIGRLNKAKNIFSLLDAISKTKYQLDIVGDGELKKKIENHISKNNISAKLLGNFKNSDMPQIINKYPVFVLISHYEGNPKALLEAMACSRAVICSDIEAITEIIKDGENGLVCEKDSESISIIISKLMQDRYLQKKLGTSAREFILDNCQLNKITNNEFMLYRSLVNKS